MDSFTDDRASEASGSVGIVGFVLGDLVVVGFSRSRRSLAGGDDLVRVVSWCVFDDGRSGGSRSLLAGRRGPEEPNQHTANDQNDEGDDYPNEWARSSGFRVDSCVR